MCSTPPPEGFFTVLQHRFQVGLAAESLFRELDSLFLDSWARPGVDLQPEMASLRRISALARLAPQGGHRAFRRGRSCLKVVISSFFGVLIYFL